MAARMLWILFGTLLIVSDCAAARHAAAFPDPLAAVMLGLVLAELGLATLWAASLRSWAPRTGVVAAAIGGDTWLLSLYSAPSWSAWAGLLLAYCGVLSLAHACFSATSTQSGDGRLGQRQFSLSTIFEVVTTSSLVLGVCTWLALPSVAPLTALVSVVLLGVCFRPALCLALAPRYRGMNLLILGASALALATLHPGPAMLLLPCVLGVQTLVALLAGLVIATARGVPLAAPAH